MSALPLLPTVFRLQIRSSGLGSISDYIDAIRYGHEVARRRQRFVAVAYKQLPRDEMPVDTPVASASVASSAEDLRNSAFLEMSPVTALLTTA
ncbi:unnamed protein product [Heligmosomoides polygyrus]|uniref:Uncharacterized protein n=1 Tax=Heligmosomoides polygyrus TaxID=6339 RepID=A0A183F866_HELPZ|nr:unnamed protein product [Heligmosomoides polygyrus]